jgi:aarF domain-containing kinase
LLQPGNLIRTPDGKICVLDFGLMTEVTAEQRIALVEYISHLTTQVGGTIMYCYCPVISTASLL